MVTSELTGATGIKMLFLVEVFTYYLPGRLLIWYEPIYPTRADVQKVLMQLDSVVPHKRLLEVY